MSADIKHGDEVVLDIDGEKHNGRIEERMLNQWPDTRSRLFVVVPLHFPILVSDFINNYGTIEKK